MSKTPVENEYNFIELKQRFFDINEKRIKRVDEDLHSRQREFLTLLPLLFHVNHPLLPGYVSKNTPRGIPLYTPDQNSLHLAKRISRSFTYKKVAYRKFDIDAIYLMGSSGTIAYNDKSDFDIWICHRETLEAHLHEELQKKTSAIQEWAQSIDVDANIYLVNPQKIRNGEFGFLTDESSGSALGVLLLEEFYRTSVLLHGLYPLWWLVPPEVEYRYEDYVAELKQKRFVYSKGYIDFGGLRTINANEFYGATLWLLYKGINSPYKSILKILLMQSYASEFPNINMLGMNFKISVYAGEDNLNLLDPYIMMLKKVEEFLAKEGSEERLLLVRRSFYIKVNEYMSQVININKQSWRQNVLSELIKEWGWSISDVAVIDERDKWKINQVVKERNLIINEFKSSYRFLSDFSYQHVKDESFICEADLNVLGRKIYSAFERKPGKIELLYRGISNQLFESHLSLHKLYSDKKIGFWVVFPGIVSKNKIESTEPLKRSLNLVELLSWCYFNKIMNKKTIVSLYEDNSGYSNKEIELLVNNMDNTFSEVLDNEISNNNYSQAANIVKNVTYINAGIDPLSLGHNDNLYIASELSDAFKYGAEGNNLAVTIDQICLTSWNEILVFSYRGILGLMECLKEHMFWSPPSNGLRPPAINAFSFSSYRGESISKRFEKLFNEVYDCFYANQDISNVEYILGLENNYYLLNMEGDNLIYAKIGGYDKLISKLSNPCETFKYRIFDGETLKSHILSLLYRKNIEGQVQCFYEINNDIVDIYILDEKGSLFYQEAVFFNTPTLMQHYTRFFDSIHARMNYISHQSTQDITKHVDVVKFYMLQRNKDGHKILSEQSINKYIQVSNYISLQAMVDLVGNKPIYTLFYEDDEFSSLQYGSELYSEIVRRVFSSRGSEETYDIYVTDVALSLSVINMSVNSLQTSRFLYFKKQIEEKLKQAAKLFINQN
jgi:adenylate cyclase class 1